MEDFSRSYTSRKFVLTLSALVLSAGMTVFSAWFPGIQGVLPTFTGSLLGILSLYFAGNVSNKFVMGKQVVEIERIHNPEPKLETKENSDQLD